MELKLRDGDYVRGGEGALARADGKEELLERVLYRLTVRRGSFPFDETLGSELHLLGREKPSERLLAAKKYVAEALAGEQGVSVTDVGLAPAEDGMLLTVHLRCQNEDAALSVRLGGE